MGFNHSELFDFYKKVGRRSFLDVQDRGFTYRGCDGGTFNNTLWSVVQTTRLFWPMELKVNNLYLNFAKRADPLVPVEEWTKT